VGRTLMSAALDSWWPKISVKVKGHGRGRPPHMTQPARPCRRSASSAGKGAAKDKCSPVRGC
jgi:hypothetical protein